MNRNKQSCISPFKVRILLLLIIPFGFSTDIIAQAVNDAGLWTTINVEKKFKNNVSIFLTEEYRRKENFTRTNLFYTDLGVEVRPLNFLKVSLAYRMIEKYLIDNTFSYRHRLMLNITLKDKIGNLSLSYRQRIQAEERNIFSSPNGSIPEWYSRNKFELKYDLNKPVTPYLAIELRYQINDPRNTESNGLWHRRRYVAGIDYKKSDRSTYGLYYLIQNEYNVSAPENLYIIGLEYSLTL